MSLDIELYAIEETPLDGFIPRIRAIADELFALRDESTDADSAYEKLANVADELERRKKITHWEWCLAWYAVEWQSVKNHDVILRPFRHGITKSSELVPHLVAAIDQLSAVANHSPAVTRSLSFLREYLSACQRFPDAFVYTSG